MGIRPEVDRFPGPDILEVVWQELNQNKYFIGVKLKYKDAEHPKEVVAMVGKEELNYYQSKYPNREIKRKPIQENKTV